MWTNIERFSKAVSQLGSTHIFWQFSVTSSAFYGSDIANFGPFVTSQLILSNADVHGNTQNRIRKEKKTFQIGFTRYTCSKLLSFIWEKIINSFDKCGKLPLLTFVVNFAILSTLSVTNIIRESMLFHNSELCQIKKLFLIFLWTKTIWMLKMNLALNSSPIKSLYEAVTIVNMNKYVRILMKFLPKISSWRQRKNFCARMANIEIWTWLKIRTTKNIDWQILWWTWFG